MNDEPPDYIAVEIRRRIAEDDRTSELGVQVDVRGGAVFLRGEVGSDERRRAAGAVAREVSPDLPVHNELTVTDTGDATSEEHFA